MAHIPKEAAVGVINDIASEIQRILSRRGLTSTRFWDWKSEEHGSLILNFYGQVQVSIPYAGTDKYGIIILILSFVEIGQTSFRIHELEALADRVEEEAARGGMRF